LTVRWVATCQIERRLLPDFKLGRLWCARRSTLKEHFARLEQEAMSEGELMRGWLLLGSPVERPAPNEMPPPAGQLAKVLIRRSARKRRQPDLFGNE
jgi:hypothetical protein